MIPTTNLPHRAEWRQNIIIFIYLRLAQTWHLHQPRKPRLALTMLGTPPPLMEPLRLCARKGRIDELWCVGSKQQWSVLDLSRLDQLSPINVYLQSQCMSPRLGISQSVGVCVCFTFFSRCHTFSAKLNISINSVFLWSRRRGAQSGNRAG